MATLTPGMVIRLMQEGMRQTEIAAEYEVSRQYVHKLAKEGGHEVIVTKVTDNFPWEITESMLSNTLYGSLRLYGHYQLDPKGLTGSSLTKVKAFLNKIERFNQVVDCNPAYPAVPGLTNTPGFAYVPRTEADEDYVIKIRPGVRLTDTGKKIWRLPEVSP